MVSVLRTGPVFLGTNLELDLMRMVLANSCLEVDLVCTASPNSLANIKNIGWQPITCSQQQARIEVLEQFVTLLCVHKPPISKQLSGASNNRFGPCMLLFRHNSTPFLNIKRLLWVSILSNLTLFNEYWDLRSSYPVDIHPLYHALF